MPPRQQRPFTKRFNSDAQMFLHLPSFLGGEARHFFFNGTRTFRFEPIGGTGKANVTLTDFRLTRAATSVAMGNPRGDTLRHVAVPTFTFTPAQVAVKTVRGTADLATGAFSIQYEVEFSSRVLNLFREAGIDETVPLILVESGTFTMGRGSSMRSRFAFKVRHDYRGRFQVGCWGKVCTTEASIFATLDLGPEGLISGLKTIYICPGDTVTLNWFTTDAESVTIDASSGPPINATDLEGNVNVTPDQTTTYTIKATGKCDAVDLTTVVVVDKPMTFEMVATNGLDEWKWLFITPGSAFSPNLHVTRIQPKGTNSGFAHEPLIVGLNYLNCNPPDGHRSNVRWFGHYEGLNSTTPLVFNVDETHATCGDTIADNALTLPRAVPIIGSWLFEPLEQAAEKPPKGTATFLVEIACK